MLKYCKSVVVGSRHTCRHGTAFSQSEKAMTKLFLTNSSGFYDDLKYLLRWPEVGLGLRHDLSPLHSVLHCFLQVDGLQRYLSRLTRALHICAFHRPILVHAFYVSQAAESVRFCLPYDIGLCHQFFQFVVLRVLQLPSVLLVDPIILRRNFLSVIRIVFSSYS